MAELIDLLSRGQRFRQPIRIERPSSTLGQTSPPSKLRRLTPDETRAFFEGLSSN